MMAEAIPVPDTSDADRLNALAVQGGDPLLATVPA
jgi:hypothetical protein